MKRRGGFLPNPRVGESENDVGDTENKETHSVNRSAGSSRRKLKVKRKSHLPAPGTGDEERPPSTGGSSLFSGVNLMAGQGNTGTPDFMGASRSSVNGGSSSFLDESYGPMSTSRVSLPQTNTPAHNTSFASSDSFWNSKRSAESKVPSFGTDVGEKYNARQLFPEKPSSRPSLGNADETRAAVSTASTTVGGNQETSLVVKKSNGLTLHEFYNEFAKLNRSMEACITKKLKKYPVSDWTPTFRDYIKYAEQLHQRLSGGPNNTKSHESARETRDSPRHGRTVSSMPQSTPTAGHTLNEMASSEMWSSGPPNASNWSPGSLYDHPSTSHREYLSSSVNFQFSSSLHEQSTRDKEAIDDTTGKQSGPFGGNSRSSVGYGLQSSSILRESGKAGPPPPATTPGVPSKAFGGISESKPSVSSWMNDDPLKGSSSSPMLTGRESIFGDSQTSVGGFGVVSHPSTSTNTSATGSTISANNFLFTGSSHGDRSSGENISSVAHSASNTQPGGAALFSNISSTPQGSLPFQDQNLKQQDTARSSLFPKTSDFPRSDPFSSASDTKGSSTNSYNLHSASEKQAPVPSTLFSDISKGTSGSSTGTTLFPQHSADTSKDKSNSSTGASGLFPQHSTDISKGTSMFAQTSSLNPSSSGLFSGLNKETRATSASSTPFSVTAESGGAASTPLFPNLSKQTSNPTTNATSASSLLQTSDQEYTRSTAPKSSLLQDTGKSESETSTRSKGSLFGGLFPSAPSSSSGGSGFGPFGQTTSSSASLGLTNSSSDGDSIVVGNATSHGFGATTSLFGGTSSSNPSATNIFKTSSNLFPQNASVAFGSNGQSSQEEQNQSQDQNGTDQQDSGESQERQIKKLDILLEGDEQLMEQRSKLYRFGESGWIEIGVGILHIIRNKNTSNLRVCFKWVVDESEKLLVNGTFVEKKPPSKKTISITVSEKQGGKIVMNTYLAKVKTEEMAEQLNKALE
eukprot:gb/GECG01013286.1/.p1 GENE.gb/GECG01013286.1/~~gb/GECG01013286.1/.p1  ORF type:complete len:973 (+),score=120.96 gb/GECG01013286.1/:1-2919(+)